MPPYGEPDWATPGDTSNTATENAGTSAPVTASQVKNDSEALGRAKMFVTLYSLINFGLAAMMGALGIITILNFNLDLVDDFTLAFLGGYMVVFATILFLYEFVWWQPIASLNKTFRKNFGFMYGVKGKGFYLVFIAFLCLGLKDDSKVKTLNVATGIGWLFMGVVHVFCGCTWPELNEAYRPPTIGLTDASDNV